MNHEYESFREFYEGYYLPGHSHHYTKLFHLIGLLGASYFAFRLFSSWEWINLLYGLLSGYGFAVISHYLFEGNQPATYKYPVYSFFGDFVMVYEILLGRHKIL